MTKILKVSPAEWESLRKDAHAVAFGAYPALPERVDYALLAMNESFEPLGYLTARELDDESVYWGYGGGTPESKDSLKAVRTYQALVDWTRERYRYVTTRIENDNIRYLKLAMSVGFRVIGTRTVKGTVLLEMMLDFKGDV